MNETENCSNFFTLIPFSFDVTLVSVIAVIGIALNLIILICYSKIKSPICSYIEALVILDILILLNMIAIFCVRVTLSCKAFDYLRKLRSLLAGHYLLTPLFLALDRFLIVVSPMNFRNYTKPMRIAKSIVVVLTFVLSALAIFLDDFIPEESVAYMSILRTTTAWIVLQLIVCIVLYLIIVCKIFVADGKWKAHRHVANE